MKVRTLFLLLLLILLHTSLHLYSTKNANFYFTVDQGRDALVAREIIVRHQFILQGPRTGAIENLYVGPFWYYFVAFGYLLSNGNPWGAVWVMVFINSLVIWLVFKFSQKYLKLIYAFFLTLGLIVFERFWFTAQFSLNPHLLPLLTLGLTFSLAAVFQEKKRFLILAACCCGMVVHSELAFVPVAFLTYLSFSIYFLLKRKISLKLFLVSAAVFVFFLIPHFISETGSRFSQSNAIIRSIAEPTGIIGKTTFVQRFTSIVTQFLQLFGKSIIPQNEHSGLWLLIISVLYLGFNLYKKRFPKIITYIFSITVFMLVVSLIWFAQTKEFLSWHILGLYPLVFVVLMFSLAYLKTKLGTILFLIILISQIGNFLTTYPIQLKISDDQGIFANQLLAIDAIYQESKDQGFKVYTYLQFVYDYPYQYSIWWRGIKKYGFLPCEYSTYPNTPSSLYFSAIQYYQKPTKTCTNLQFLIIEPTKDNSGFGSWYKGVTKNTELLTTKNFGKIIVEKRKTLNQ